MRDVEILLRYFGFQYLLEDYTGNLKKFLDDTVNHLNSDWEDEEESIRQVGKECDAAIETTFEIFGDDAFFRWSNGRYEGRFNRAVFDIMTYYFADPEIREATTGREEAVSSAFRTLCERNTRFVESIQTTTKTAQATHRRLSLWGRELAEALDIELQIPILRENRIVIEG